MVRLLLRPDLNLRAFLATTYDVVGYVENLNLNSVYIVGFEALLLLEV